jgi:subtilisin family serine protease
MWKTSLLIALTATGAAQTPLRPVIRTETDIEARFPVSNAPSRLIDQPAYTAMLPALRAEAERLLRGADIQDRTIAQLLRAGLANIAVLEGRKEDAEHLVAQYRSSATKPQGRLLGALPTDLATATLAAPAERGCIAAAARLTSRLAGADPAVVRDTVMSNLAELQLASVPYYAGGAVDGFDMVAKQRGSLDLLRALAIARWRVNAVFAEACRRPVSAVMRAWLAAPANRPVDIWPTRQPDAAAMAEAKPVVVAIWDSGFDVSMFPGQLARDPAEPLDGRDNDGNGVIDDVNGPTYDVALRPRAGAIMPPTRFLQARLAAQMAYDKGSRDIQFGFDTPEAAMFAAFARTALVNEQGEEFQAELENGGRVHGTACASEIADDAPYVLLYNVAALPWGRGENRREVPYDEATVARWVAAIDRIGTRMRGAGVRVVNLSWVFSAEEAAQQLLDQGLEKEPARAKNRGAAMWSSVADALRRLIVGSPGILFVAGAGNSGQDDVVQGNAVMSFPAANRLIVGATGTSGRPTNFTVTGKNVDVYAQGEAVRLRWPGDMLVHSSGTSMSAPLAARAAAQMLAINPRLTGAQVRQGLLATATPGDDGLRLLHAADAVAWARTH